MGDAGGKRAGPLSDREELKSAGAAILLWLLGVWYD